MTLESKFSSLYKARLAILTPLCLIISLVCIFNYFNDYFKLEERRFMLVVGILTTLVVIVLIIDLLDLHSVSLDEEKITLKFLISRKRVHLFYKDIVSIESTHQKYSRKSYHLTKGYFIREYHMDDGRILILSPDTYENYEDLIYTINQHTTHLK